MSEPGWSPRASSRSSSSPASSSSGGVPEQLARRLRVLVDLRLGDTEQQRRRHEPLLGAVVQVALEPPPLLVAGSDDAGARRLQVLAGLRARDGERDEVAERGEPDLAARRQWIGAADRHGAPERCPRR